MIIIQDGKFIAAGGSGSNEAKIFDRSANNAVRDTNLFEYNAMATTDL